MVLVVRATRTPTFPVSLWKSLGYSPGPPENVLLSTFPPDWTAFSSLNSLCSLAPLCLCFLCLKQPFLQVHSLRLPRPHSNNASYCQLELIPSPCASHNTLFMPLLSHSSPCFFKIRPTVRELGTRTYLGRDPRKHFEGVEGKTKKKESQ